MIIGTTNLETDAIALGCMRMSQLEDKSTETIINTALEQGITLFDHADIYGGGKSEELFGNVLSRTPSMREKMIIQTKCGICNGYYDSSAEHIMESVNQSLKRLHTEYVDILLIHRPDALMNPQEVAGAFDQLQQQGKVKHFGVSNFNTAQLRRLQNHLSQKLVVNQMQFSLMHASMISQGISANTEFEDGIDRDMGILDYCIDHNITMQAWSPLQYGMFAGNFVGNSKFPELNELLNRFAKQYDVSPVAIAIAWILRHPANMQVVAGTMNPQHLIETCMATKVQLTRKEWYQLYVAAGYQLP